MNELFLSAVSGAAVSAKDETEVNPRCHVAKVQEEYESNVCEQGSAEIAL